jgi:hypothetical protein
LSLGLAGVNDWVRSLLLTRLTILLWLSILLRLTILLRLSVLLLLRGHKCVLRSHLRFNLGLFLLLLKLLLLPLSERLLSWGLHGNHDVKHLDKITCVLVWSVANTNPGHIRLQKRT